MAREEDFEDSSGATAVRDTPQLDAETRRKSDEITSRQNDFFADPASGAELPKVERTDQTAAAPAKPKRMMTPELYERLKNPIAEPRDEEEYNMLPEGKKWRDPKGNVRVKPYQLASPDEYWNLPTGAHWKGEDGKVREKPEYHGIGFTAQSLYSMALTDEGRHQVLEKFYGKDKVKRGPGGRLYVEDDDGILRAPGHGASRLGAAVAETPIAAGMTAGFLAGGGPTPLGAAGAAAGGVLGAMEGRAVNNLVLSLAGIHESPAEQIKAVGWEGAATAGGEVVGKVAARVPGAVKSVAGMVKRGVGKGVEKGGEFLRTSSGLVDFLEGVGVTPERARWITGTPLEEAQLASDITEKGGRVAPSAFMHEAPYIRKVQEFDAIFRAQNVFGQEAEKFYNQEATKIAEHPEIAATVDEVFTAATKGVSGKKAGDLAISAAQHDAAFADAALENAKREAEAFLKEPIVAQGGEAAVARKRAELIKQLETAATESRMAAEKVFQEAVSSLRNDVNILLRQAGEGEDPSAVVRMLDARFRAYNAAVRARARVMYTAGDAAAAGEPVNVSGLVDAATDFFNSIPQIVRQKYPAEVNSIMRLANQENKAAAEAITIERPVAGIEALATESERKSFQRGVADAKAGRPATNLQDSPEGRAYQKGVDSASGKTETSQFHPGGEPEPFTGGELRNLRSWLRHGIDYHDLAPDMRKGSLKFFANKINEVLHDPNATPGLKQAAKLWDEADKFYREHVPFLGDEMVKQTLRALKSGVGVNSEMAANIFFKPGRTAALRQAREIVGENAWQAVEAARVRSILDNAQDMNGMFDGKSIAEQVVEDAKNGLLQSGYNIRNIERLVKIAENAEKLGGKLPIHATDTDTITTLLRKVEQAQQAVEVMANNDPLKALSAEVKKLDTDFNRAMAQQAKTRGGEPLSFLYQPSALAVKSAERIVSNPDLSEAAANMFGRDSKEFKALQEYFVLKFFQRPSARAGLLRQEMAGEVSGVFGKSGLTDEQLALYFPGVTRGQLDLLAKEMEFLVGGLQTESFGGGMAGAARVLNPLSHVPIPGIAMKLITGIPGINFGARFTLGKLFALTMDATSHPEFIHWLAGRLKGSAEDRAMAKFVLQQRLMLGGWFGAAGAEQFTGPSNE